MGFPMAMAAIMIIGTALVAFSWTAREVEALSPTFGDHWHHAFGIWDCTTESWAPNLQDPQTSNSGIHTHGDGVIHNHPQSSLATGTGATLERFFESVREDLSDDAVTFTDGTAISEDGAQCEGESAVLHAARFAPGANEPIEVITEDIASMRLLNDGEGYVVALVPEGSDIPAPPEDSARAAGAASPNILQTTGLSDLNLDPSGIDGATAVGGFNADGVLVDDLGNPILDADGNEITQASIEADLAESQEAEESDAESGE